MSQPELGLPRVRFDPALFTNLIFSYSLRPPASNHGSNCGTGEGGVSFERAIEVHEFRFTRGEFEQNLAG